MFKDYGEGAVLGAIESLVRKTTPTISFFGALITYPSSLSSALNDIHTSIQIHDLQAKLSKKN